MALVVAGGTVTVDSKRDGIDVNGTVTMSGGTVIVEGPAAQMLGALALDRDRGWDQTGGTLVATGGSGMESAPDSGSAQPSLVSTFSSQAAGTTVQIISTDGQELVTVTPTKAFASTVVSTPDISVDATCQVMLDGTVVDETTTADAATSGIGGPGGQGRPSRPPLTTANSTGRMPATLGGVIARGSDRWQQLPLTTPTTRYARPIP